MNLRNLNVELSELKALDVFWFSKGFRGPFSGPPEALEVPEITTAYLVPRVKD